METVNEVEQPQQKRPVFLTVIGILTFINAGIGVLGALFSFLSGPASKDEVESMIALNMKNIEPMRAQGMNGFADTMEKMVNSIQYANDAHFLATSLNFVISALAIVGVVMMFRQQKIGFHLYIIGCLLRIGSYYFYTPASEVPGFVVGYFTFTSLLFIFMYSRNLKWMRSY